MCFDCKITCGEKCQPLPAYHRVPRGCRVRILVEAGAGARRTGDEPAIIRTQVLAHQQGWHGSPRYYCASKHGSIDDSQSASMVRVINRVTPGSECNPTQQRQEIVGEVLRGIVLGGNLGRLAREFLVKQVQRQIVRGAVAVRPEILQAHLVPANRERRVAVVRRQRLARPSRRAALTPGCQIGYMDHTGCHQGPYWLSSRTILAVINRCC
jgi:hypothetical protein